MKVTILTEFEPNKENVPMSQEFVPFALERMMSAWGKPG